MRRVKASYGPVSIVLASFILFSLFSRFWSVLFGSVGSPHSCVGEVCWLACVFNALEKRVEVYVWKTGSDEKTSSRRLFLRLQGVGMLEVESSENRGMLFGRVN